MYLSREVDLSSLWHLFAHEVPAELNDNISFTLNKKLVNYVIIILSVLTKTIMS